MFPILATLVHNITPPDISKDADIEFKKWIDLLKEFIEDEFKIKCRASGRAVTFPVLCEDVRLKVDLLVSPYWNHQKEFYDFLRYIPKEERARYVPVNVIAYNCK